MLIEDEDHLVSKTDMTRVEGENTRLRHDLAQLHRKTLCDSKSVEMLKHSIRLLLHYLKESRNTRTSLIHPFIQQRWAFARDLVLFPCLIAQPETGDFKVSGTRVR
jgi:hypothetical protein